MAQVSSGPGWPAPLRQVVWPWRSPGCLSPGPAGPLLQGFMCCESVCPRTRYLFLFSPFKQPLCVVLPPSTLVVRAPSPRCRAQAASLSLPVSHWPELGPSPRGARNRGLLVGAVPEARPHAYTGRTRSPLCQHLSLGWAVQQDFRGAQEEMGGTLELPALGCRVWQMPS